MPKKQASAAAAILTSSVEEDLVKKLAQRLLVIRGSTGSAGASKAKSDMTCYFWGKVGHMKRDCIYFKKQLNNSNYAISPICLLINEKNWLCGEIKSSKIKGNFFFSSSLEEHKQHVEAVLKILKNDGLIANEKK